MKDVMVFPNGIKIESTANIVSITFVNGKKVEYDKLMKLK